MVRHFLSVALFLCVGGIAIGAHQAEGLRGLTHLGLQVEELDQETQSCGITRDLIRDAIAYPISSSRLGFSDDDRSPKLYVHVASLVQRQPLQCFSLVSFEVVNLQKVQLDYTDEPPRYVVVQLWQHYWLGVSIPERHSEKVRDGIENVTKKLIAAWYLANKP